MQNHYKCLFVFPKRILQFMQILQSRVGPSTMGFSPDMPMAYPPLHSSQQGLIRAGLSGLGSSSDLHRRTINSQLTPMTGGFKEPTRVSLNP